MPQMAYANQAATALLEISVTRKMQKAPLPTMCASTFVVSHSDWECTVMEKPQGCGYMNGQVPTFDSTVLYPQLWINDSKGPHPRGLMCSARISQSTHSKKCAFNSIQYSYTVTVNVGTALLLLSFRNQLCVKGNRNTTVCAKVRLSIMCRTVK